MPGFCDVTGVGLFSFFQKNEHEPSYTIKVPHESERLQRARTARMFTEGVLGDV